MAITVAFLNTASQSAYVEYFVYKDTVNADRLLEQGIINEIEADGMTSKTLYWNGLTEGQHRVWVAFEHDGDTRQTFSVPFEVSGLPDLRVTGAELAGASNLKTKTPPRLRSRSATSAARAPRPACWALR